MKKNIASLSFKKIDIFILSFIILVAVIFRLYQIDTPLADLHSWRQTDTAAVARNFVKEGFDLLHPRYDDLSNIQTGVENPQGYRFVEFPVYSAIFGFLYKYAPLFSLEIYGRLTTILLSLAIIAVIYYIALKESSRKAAFIAASVYATMPFFVFFSRAILPETAAVSFMMLSILFLYRNIHTKIKWKSVLLLALSILCFSLSVLIKPTTIFYGVVILYLLYRKYGYMLLTKIGFYAYFILALTPLVLWRYYITLYPEGIPASDWLITSVNTSEGLQNIFLKPSFFRWIFFERINNLIFGGFAALLFILGVVKRQKTWLFYSFLASAFLYLFTFQGGNVQHEYYQIIILPVLALFAGLGSETLLENKKVFIHPIASGFVIFVLFVTSFYFSYMKVKDYYSYPQDLQQIANIIQTLTSKDDKIVTDTLGDTTLLYLSDRKGAPAVYKDLQELKKIGYKYFYTAKGDVIEQIKKEGNFEVTFENNKFALFKL